MHVGIEGRGVVMVDNMERGFQAVQGVSVVLRAGMMAGTLEMVTQFLQNYI